MASLPPHTVIDRFLAQNDLPLAPPSPCPYLPDRQARTEGFLADELDPDLYAAFMDRGFRRSGRFFYRPRCATCTECVPLRVDVLRFKPSRSQRRIQRKNADLSVTIARPSLTGEKFNLYRRYLDQRHDGTMGHTWAEMATFLYESPVRTQEITYRVDGRLIGVSIVDRAPTALSTVYMYFDPDVSARSPGTFSMLWEIEHCRRSGIPFYYLGYYVADCNKMSYKAAFRPHERLTVQHEWVAADDARAAPNA